MAITDVRYDTLGQLLCDSVPSEARKTLLYVEFDDGVISPAVFYELENGDLHYFPPETLDDELFRMQEVFGPEVKAMEFEMAGSKFSTRFTYDGVPNPCIDLAERRTAAAVRVFGHASAIYQSL